MMNAAADRGSAISNINYNPGRTMPHWKDKRDLPSPPGRLVSFQQACVADRAEPGTSTFL